MELTIKNLEISSNIRYALKYVDSFLNFLLLFITEFVLNIGPIDHINIIDKFNRYTQ